MDLRIARAEFLYHGTGSKYLEMQIKKYGRYQHDNDSYDNINGLFVGTSLDSSLRYAHDNVFHYTSSHPVVLKIPAGPIRHRVHDHPVIPDTVIDFLELHEFEVIHFERDMEIFRQIGRLG